MIPLDTLHCNGVETLTHKHTHVLPYDRGYIINGLAHLAEVPAVPHIPPYQHTQQGDVETKDGHLRERLDPEHVQDAGEEVGDGHHGEEDGQRAVGVEDVFAVVFFHKGVLGFQDLLLQFFLVLSAESLPIHLARGLKLCEARLSQLLVLGFQLLRCEVG